MVVGACLKFWKIGQYSIWGLLNWKYEVNKRQVPDSPAPRQGANESISGITSACMSIPFLSLFISFLNKNYSP